MDFLELVRAFIQRNLERLRKLTSVAAADKEDVEHTAITVALELHQESGGELDLNSASLAETFWRRVDRAWRAWRKGGFGASLDELRGEKGGDSVALMDLLTASADSDPLERILAREDSELFRHPIFRLKDETYSQFAAYLVALDRFDYHRSVLAEFLAISTAALHRRVRRSYDVVLTQPSLFDRLARIGEDFSPLQGRPSLRRPRQQPVPDMGLLF